MPFTSPAAGIWGPKVMIIDENAGSGGDLLPWMFRKLQVGPLTLPRSYIYATRITPADTFGRFSKMTKGNPAWSYYEIDASHSPNVTAPEALTALLQKIDVPDGDLAELGKKRALDFSWDKAAERTLEVYAEALTGAGTRNREHGARKS